MTNSFQIKNILSGKAIEMQGKAAVPLSKEMSLITEMQNQLNYLSQSQENLAMDKEKILQQLVCESKKDSVI